MRLTSAGMFVCVSLARVAVADKDDEPEVRAAATSALAVIEKQ